MLTKYGSDKCTAHSYGEFYKELFATAHPSVIMEIGVDRGQSIQAWAELFPESIVVGVDMKPTCVCHEIPKNIRLVTATTPDYGPVIGHIKRTGIRPNVIIDDGSHYEHDQVTGAHCLMPYLADDGVYVIEDIQNIQIAERFAVYGWTIHDFRSQKNRWDDIIVSFRKPVKK